MKKLKEMTNKTQQRIELKNLQVIRRGYDQGKVGTVQCSD
jgi:hypothetical protein